MFGWKWAGYRMAMSDNSELRHAEDSEAVQAVFDRVLSWQEGAPVETVREELEKGLSEIGESRPEEWLQDNAERISKADPAGACPRWSQTTASRCPSSASGCGGCPPTRPGGWSPPRSTPATGTST